jgi:hypothetical protein
MPRAMAGRADPLREKLVEKIQSERLESTAPSLSSNA